MYRKYFSKYHSFQDFQLILNFRIQMNMLIANLLYKLQESKVLALDFFLEWAEIKGDKKINATFFALIDLLEIDQVTRIPKKVFYDLGAYL
ncbi:MAG: hypothetical protein AABY27_04220, partial [Pseudomonadota bacterium]